jgi:uncharacterized protein YbjT (DUF2867 family)
VAFDYDQPATFAAALDGVDRVYQAAPGDAAAAPQIAFIDIAVAAGVKRIVKLSAMGVEHGDYPLRQVEKHIESQPIEWTHLRPTWFLQNFATAGAAGIKQGTLAEPAGDGQNAFIDTRDIAAVALLALTEPGHHGKGYALTGPRLHSRHDVAAAISEVIGRKVTYLPISDAQFREAVGKFMPPSYIELLSALYGVVRAGHLAVKTDVVKQLLGREPIGLTQFAQDHQSVWR